MFCVVLFLPRILFLSSDVMLLNKYKCDKLSRDSAFFTVSVLKT